MKTIFHAVDENRDGMIEHSDYVKLVDNLASLRGWSLGSPEYNQLHDAYMFLWTPIQTLRLSLDEYLNLLGGMMDTPEARELNRSITKTVFDMIDTDRDDKVGLPEYSQFLEAHHIGADAAAEAFKHLDTNGDGALTRDEFSQISTEFYFSDDENAAGNWLWGSF